MINIEIGNRIKHARSLRDVTLDEIAKEVGVAKSTVQRYESGKINNIKLPVVESIAAALKVNPAWLIGKSDIMEIPPLQIPLILEYYNSLNEIGKNEATKRVEELTHISRYTSSPDTSSVLMAAHNDHMNEPGELEKMRRDLENLKRP